MSIGKLGAGQASYYERQVAQGRDDYYSGRGEMPGVWTGRGARALGLDGAVEAGRFNALMSGVDPSDPELGRPLRASRGEVTVVGFDLTFSAPKSVSVLFAAGDERAGGELVAAHESAVAAALEYIEDEAVKVRRGRGGEQVEAGEGVVAAAYRHRMSRALDPQLHTHVVCANAARGPDGRWTALDGRHLYEHARTAGFLYQAHLRAEVRDRLGLAWGQVSQGMADLVDVPSEVLGAFSRRRREIVEAAQEAGVEALASERGKYLAVSTRDRKQYGIETHSWRAEIRARAAEHGLDRAAVERLVANGRARLDAVDRVVGAAGGEDRERAVGDRLAGAGGLTEKANTFVGRDVLREYAAAAGQGVRVREVRGQGARFAGRGDVLDTVHGELTTLDLVASERRLIAAAVGRTGEGSAIVPPGVLDRALAAADRPLTTEQAAAVRGVAGSGNGVDVIEALAGTGKTFTAGVLARAYEAAGHRVISVAPTGRAVRELAEEASVPAWTLDRALIDLERGGPLPPRTVVLFDEAGMAATRLSERLLGAAQVAEAKVVAIGDSGQLPAVQAGGWMRAVGDRVGRHRLTEVMRQRDPQERRALARLHDGQPDAYLTWAQTNDRLHVHADQAAMPAALADWKRAVDEHGVAQAVLIARSNTTRAALNDAARETMRARGRLGEDATYGPVTVAVGDRVICRRNDRFADVDNGTRGTVRATHPDRVVIETDAGPVRQLPAGYVAEHLEHAYCLTGHGMQGATVQCATVLATPRELTKGWSYTALSRARGTTRLHLDGQDVPADPARAEFAPGERRATPDPTVVLQHAAARMTIRDDEDLAIAQLPTRAAPGQVDEFAIAPQTSSTPAPAVPETLVTLRSERNRLVAQRASLPVRELRLLDRLEGELAQLVGERASVLARLKRLPDPGRGLLGRGRDPHAAERTRLAAALGAADDQQATLDRQRARTARHIGPHDQVRAERDGLDRRIAQLDRQHDQLRRRLVDRQLERAATWAPDLLGLRPSDDRRRAEHWDRAARTIAKYRVDHDIADMIAGLGPEPKDTHTHRHWNAARDAVEREQRRLGRDTGRNVQRDRGRPGGLER